MTGCRILCQGGPYDGMYHEGEEGWPMPNRMGLKHPIDEDDPAHYWYDIRDGVAVFDPKGDPQWDQVKTPYTPD